MKKVLQILFLVIIASALSGCLSQNSPPPAEPATPPQPITPPAATPALLQPAKIPSQPKAAQKTQEVSVESGNLYFKPAAITVKVNQPVRVNISNKGGHTFTISEFGVDVLLNGPSASATFTPTKTGTFPITCEIPGHKEAGMKGALIVTE